MKPSIIVSIPMAFGVRNVLRSGLYQHLSEQFRVVIALPAEGKQTLLEENIPENDIWPGIAPHEQQLHNLILEMLKGAHSHRHATQSDQVLRPWLRRRRITTSRKWLKFRAAESLGTLLSAEPIFSQLEQLEKRLYQCRLQRSLPDLRAALQLLQPVASLSTSCFAQAEWPIFRTLWSMGIPTLTHILSFDNLTSRSYLPIRGFDHYMVWQQRMAGELQIYYDVDPNRITITGTPQFDFHVRDDFRWSREQTSQALGIEPQTPYFVYCANHEWHTPNEPQLVLAIVQEMAKHEHLRNHRWVVRPHPIDQYTRWNSLLSQTDRVVLSLPWQQDKNRRHWGVPSHDEVGLLGNTLRHADAMLTVASTTALDGAVVDTPIICMGFHPTAPAEENTYYREVHYSHHYAPIVDSGAVRLATSMEALTQYLSEAVNNPAALRAQRQQLVNGICGPVDGKAAERIAITVINQVCAERRS